MEQLNVDDVINFLRPIAGKLDLEQVHWIRGDDESYCWCHGCAKAVARHLRRRNKKRRGEYEYIVDGGWGSEEDTPAFCYGCGKKLDYTLTNIGVAAELYHFLENKPEAITSDIACEMLEVFEGGQWIKKLHLDLNVLAGYIRNRMST